MKLERNMNYSVEELSDGEVILYKIMKITYKILIFDDNRHFIERLCEGLSDVNAKAENFHMDVDVATTPNACINYVNRRASYRRRARRFVVHCAEEVHPCGFRCRATTYDSKERRTFSVNVVKSPDAPTQSAESKRFRLCDFL